MFINVQLGGSGFRHGETRSKQFAARFNVKPDGSASASEMAKSHKELFEELYAFLDSVETEVYANDDQAIANETRLAAIAERGRSIVERDRGDRPAPKTFDPDEIPF